jgi:predicted NAD/FAD-binding protein
VRIAIVGSGISGLGAAWLLNRQGHAVTLFEAERRLGGHTATVDVTLDGRTFPVDTGFLVFNDHTYPRLIALFDELGVESVASEMSFSCRVDRARLEWAGTDFLSLFAQPANALRPAFWRMLADIARFNREATALDEGRRQWSITLGDYLEAGRYSVPFRDWYLLPMAAAIWSAPRRDILDFPLPTFVRFCRNHGLLQVTGRPQWRTVLGGARVYVEKIAAQLPDVRVGTPVHRIVRTKGGVTIDSAMRTGEAFDAVVLACHSDQALALLGDPSRSEQRLLSAVRYQPNRVVLHTDPALLPRARRRRCDRTAPGRGLVPDQQAAAAAVHDAGHRHAEPAFRAGPGARTAGIHLFAPAAGQRGGGRRGRHRATLRTAAHVVCRRLARLWLS